MITLPDTPAAMAFLTLFDDLCEKYADVEPTNEDAVGCEPAASEDRAT